MTRPTATAQRRYSATTHTGHVRKVNEDAILSRPDIGLWAVADGMGGHAGGDFASQTVVAALDRLSAMLQPAEIMHSARSAIQTAHREIGEEAARRGHVTIGATVVLLVLTEEHFMCLWAGDSRLYRLRGGTLQMISADHSVVGELVEQGYLTWDEAENHPQANRITRAVGVGEVLEIDKRRGDVQPGDRFLLCSDGLSKYADLETLRSYLSDGPTDRVADALLEHALAGGGADNVSIIVVDT